MHCVLLLKDAMGRLPSAQDLLRCGFHVSTAVLPEEEEHPSVARAAETPGQYSSEASRPPALAAAPAMKALEGGGS